MQESAKYEALLLVSKTRLRAPTSLAPLHAFCTICYASRCLYALRDCAPSASHDVMAHNICIHVAEMVDIKEKIYKIVHVRTQKRATGSRPLVPRWRLAVHHAVQFCIKTGGIG